ncbi:hypothetical protein [Parashewanella tropica]|uniref:hypothetical protein n=1 Tax=Parashewanella tropica TaxID=2547970 RepID=UPI001059B32A|nr:hypothetical protein [Parashewanella tropica]
MSLDLVWNCSQQELDRLENLKPCITQKKETSARILITGIHRDKCKDVLFIKYNQKLRKWEVTVNHNPHEESRKACNALRVFLNGKTEYPDLTCSEVDGFLYVGSRPVLSQHPKAWKAATTQSKGLSLAALNASATPLNVAASSVSEQAKPKIKEPSARPHFDSPESLISRIHKLLHSKYDERTYLDCYIQVTETLLSDEWASVQERDKDGSIKRMKLDPEIELAVKQLIVQCVEHKYSEFLELQKNGGLDKRKQKEWMDEGNLYSSRCASSEEVLPYAALLSSWTLILRQVVFQLSPYDSASDLRYELRGLFNDLIPTRLFYSISFSEYGPAKPYSRVTFNKACDKWKTEQQEYSYRPSKRCEVNPSTLDQLELFLHFVEKRPLTGATIPLVGCRVTLSKKLGGSKDKVKRTSSEAISLRLTSDHKVNPMLLESKPLVLPPRDDYQAVLTVLFPETGHLYVLPKVIDEDEAIFHQRLDALLIKEKSKKVNVVFFSVKQGSLSLLSDLSLRFGERTQFNIITPFRRLTKNQEYKPKSAKWALQHYTLMVEDLTEAMGNFGFTFYEKGQQFTLTLGGNSRAAAVQTESVKAPYTWSQELATKPSDSLMSIGLELLQSFLYQMTCCISLAGITEVNTPCLDKEGHFFDKELLLIWLQKHQTNPANNEPMTEKDIVETGIFITMIHQLRARLILSGNEEIPKADPLTEKVLEAKQRQLGRDGDRVQQLLNRKIDPIKVVEDTSSSEEDEVALEKQRLRHQQQEHTSDSSSDDDTELTKQQIQRQQQVPSYTSAV